MKKFGLYIVSLFVLLLMVMPAIQSAFHLFREQPLNGAFKLAIKPSFSWGKWNSGEFQGDMEQYLKDHTGFRNFFVRLQNQVDFMAFGQANAEGAIVGKNKQLFEYDYIRSWLAKDYPGDSFIEKKLQRTKYVQEYLKREKGIDLVIVFEPGKASFYPEYIPECYSSQKNGLSTYELYREKAADLGIDYIDFQQYFLQLKGKTDYPVFPRYGTHWSVYGMWFAADSILKTIESKRGINLTEIQRNSMVISSEPFDTDDDVLKTMNLLFPPRGEKLAYPEFSFDTAHPGNKPMVLVVADSYYWNIFNTRIPKFLFANEAFWYFNTLVYPDHYLRPSYTKDLNLQEEVEKQDIIFLMVTERFVHKFDWTFIDNLYTLYTPEWLMDPVYDKINNIMQVESWYVSMIEKAVDKEQSLEEALIQEGEFMLFQSDTLFYMVNYGPEHFSCIIENDTNWMDYIHKKAIDQQKTTEEMLLADALYIFNQNYPGLYKLNRGMAAMEDGIHSDQMMLDSLKLQAASFNFEPKLFIRIKALQLYQEEEIQKTMRAIRNDPSWLEHVKQKAAKKGILLDQMIRLDAEYQWNERMKKF